MTWTTMAALSWLALACRAEDLPARHKVVPKDTLWDLAGHYYQDNFKWRRISEANPPPNVHDPHWIYPEQILVIPGLEAPPPGEPEAPEAVPEAPAPPPPPRAAHPAGMEVVSSDGLSDRFPKGLVGQTPAMARLKAPAGWKADGAVADMDEMEAAAAEGDHVDVRMKKTLSHGERLQVYRKAAPAEDDQDKKSQYLSYVGLLEVRREVTGRVYKTVILKSNDTVQVGDLVVREKR